MKVGTARIILESLTANLGSPSRRRFRVSMGKIVRTKRRNEADPSDLERFVQLTTSNEILAL
jgi:hypothetical protein